MKNRPSVELLAKRLPGVEILGELGSGGFKVVYRSRIEDRLEALKVVHIPTDPNDASAKEQNTKRLLREIKLLAEFETPNLVKLGSLAPRELEIDSEVYVVYSEELLAGQSLRQGILDGRRPDLKELVTIGNNGLLAIEEMWSKNVIHRDIKPDNIMALGAAERPYVLLDLGVAFVVGGTPLTSDPRRIPGTLYYLAPEMLEPNFRDNFDQRVDMYALGLTLYEYAVGANPFIRREDAQYTTMWRIVRETPAPLQSIRDDLPIEFCRSIDQLLRKRPALRPNLRNTLRRWETLV